MKNKFLYIIFCFVVLTTSTGFGFLESSTIMHGRETRQIKADSLKGIPSHRLQVTPSNTYLKKGIEKSNSNQIAKSVIQWVTNMVKNMLQVILNILIDLTEIILMAIIHFLIG